MLLATAAALLLLPAEHHAQRPGGATGEYVFVGSGGGEDVGRITTYALDRATGDLTQIDRQEVGALASYLAVNPRRPVVYATNERGGNVHWLGVDPATGKLTPEGSRPGDGNPVYLSVDPSGSVLLAVNYGRGTTDAFPLDPRSGAITGAPVTHATGANSHSAVFHPSKGYVYVASVRDSLVSQYSFRGGALRPLTPPSITQVVGPRHLTLHPGGDFAYAVSGPTDNVAMFRVGADGTLSSLGTVRRLPGEFAAEAARHMGSDIHVAPSGRFVYAANRGASNTLAIYSMGADGRLALKGHESTRGSTPRNFAIDSTGELLLVGNQDSRTVAVFRVDRATGALSHLHTEEVGVAPWFVGVFRLVDER